ncbi:excinuclease ATPase subunit [Chromatiaceae bacterium AAb-1]|nr:excinuclease ATPase subunit [Chromatiaceae bacterium AAb-1]
MEIQSAFYSGLQGVQRADRLVTDATVNIHNQTVAKTQEPAVAEPVSRPAPTLEQSLIQLLQGEHLAAANVRSIQSADAMLGTLIDTRA